MVGAQGLEGDTACISPFFEGVVSKKNLIDFLEKDSVWQGVHCTSSRYIHTLKVFNRRNQLSIEKTIVYVKEMIDTSMYFDHVEVYMASRECDEGVYHFRTTLNGVYRVLAHNGAPKILTQGGYVIELFDESAFDGYYEVSGIRKYIVLEVPRNHQIHQADLK